MTRSLDDELRAYGVLLEDSAPSLTLDEVINRPPVVTLAPQPNGVRRPAVLLAAAAVLVAVVGIAAVVGRQDDAGSVRTSDTANGPSPTSSATSPASSATDTVPTTATVACSSCSPTNVDRISISRIGFAVDIQPVWDGSSTEQRPGLDAAGVDLGMPGTARIWGHRDAFGKEFEPLSSVQLGDLIEVTNDGSPLAFEVTQVEVVPVGTALAQAVGPTLTLSALASTNGQNSELRISAWLADDSAAPPAATRMTQEQISEWAGPIGIDYTDADVALGSTGTAEFRLQMSEVQFCLTPAGYCEYIDGVTPLDTTPKTGVGASVLVNPDGSWVRSIIVPSDVAVQFITAGQPACEMHRFSLEQWGNAVVWACEGRTPLSNDLEWLFSRDGELAVAVGERLSAQPLPKSDPVTATGVSIGDPADGLGPTWLGGWVPVIDQQTRVVVGYALTADTGKLSGPVPVYDELGAAIGELGDPWVLP